MQRNKHKKEKELARKYKAYAFEKMSAKKNALSNSLNSFYFFILFLIEFGTTFD